MSGERFVQDTRQVFLKAAAGNMHKALNRCIGIESREHGLDVNACWRQQILGQRFVFMGRGRRIPMQFFGLNQAAYQRKAVRMNAI